MRLESLVVIMFFVFAAACTTFNINSPQPNLQSLNTGNPSCVTGCTQTQTVTQGAGNVQGATNSTSTTESTSLGATK